ncbi:MAG: SDR family oxidoreductase [Candidatus Caldatribacteriota bacterium]|nr:SDR family oxidoreductase [Candidatus Caldatribacteriota bacterium]
MCTQSIDLKDKIAVVTGSGDLGEAIIEGLIQNYVKIIICDINLENAKYIVNKYKLSEDRLIALKVDTGDSNQVSKMVKKIIEKYKRIDILINTVGILRESSIVNTSEIEWDKTLQVNLKSLFNLCKEIIPFMIKQREGKIVNFASIAGERGSSLSVHYGSSKAGVIGFTKSLAKEVGRYGINVNAIAPGIIKTRMAKQKITQEPSKYLNQISLGRFGVPEDVVGIVLLLVSKSGNYITGQTINVNGGMM